MATSTSESHDILQAIPAERGGLDPKFDPEVFDKQFSRYAKGEISYRELECRAGGLRHRRGILRWFYALEAGILFTMLRPSRIHEKEEENADESSRLR